MKRFLIILSFMLVALVNYSQPANDNCANAITLTPNTACIGGTESGANIQAGEIISPANHCGSNTFNQSVWYSFTATSTNMYVSAIVDYFTGGGGSWFPTTFTAIVYNSTTCLPTAASIIACNTYGLDDTLITIINNITVGNTYLLQIGYRDAGGGLDPHFCISVNDYNRIECSDCNDPCGVACGFPITPTPAEVTAACTAIEFEPVLDGGSTNTLCYTFEAIATSIDFGVIITSNCGGGNVTNFSWELQESGCSGIVLSGDITNLILNPVIIGTNYTFCYTFTVPTTCLHWVHNAYFVGAQTLPIELSEFKSTCYNGGRKIEWATLSEKNVDYFMLQNSEDGVNFLDIAKIKAAGNSNILLNYSYNDNEYYGAKNIYYKLLEYDFDGTKQEFGAYASSCKDNVDYAIYPNPAKNGEEIFVLGNIKTIKVYDIIGKEMSFDFKNNILSGLPVGVFVIKINDSYISKIVIK